MPTQPAVSHQQDPQSHFEIIDAPELAKRLALPTSWVREMCRTRTSDPLPFLHFGRYKRFRWNSPELNAWISRRLRGAGKMLMMLCLCALLLSSPAFSQSATRNVGQPSDSTAYAVVLQALALNPELNLPSLGLSPSDTRVAILASGAFERRFQREVRAYSTKAETRQEFEAHRDELVRLARACLATNLSPGGSARLAAYVAAAKSRMTPATPMVEQ